MRVYHKQIDDTLKNQNLCAEIKIRAERRAGELLADIPKKHGARPSDTELHDETPSLSDLGISNIQSHRWQTESSIPEEVFEQYIAEVKEANNELTSSGVLKLAKNLKNTKQIEDIVSESIIIPQGKYRCLVVDTPWPMKKIERDQTLCELNGLYEPLSLSGSYFPPKAST